MNANTKNTINSIYVYFTFRMLNLTLLMSELFQRKRIFETSDLKSSIPFMYATSLNTFQILIIVSALYTKNIFQIKIYMMITVYGVFLSYSRLYYIFSSSVSNVTVHVIIVIKVIVAICEFAYTLILHQQLEPEYGWYYYKKIGGEEKVIQAYKTRQQIKSLIILYVFSSINFTWFYLPGIKLKISSIFRHICYLAFYFILLALYTTMNDENKGFRIFIIIGLFLQICFYIVAMTFISFADIGEYINKG